VDELERLRLDALVALDGDGGERETLRDGAPLRLGISTCLLGQRVRYDGGHKRDAFLTDILGRYVEWVPVCPELEAGLGVPREAMHLQRLDGETRLLTSKTRHDHTETLRRFSERKVAALRRENLSGYVLKRSSPSCGMEGVKIHRRKGAAVLGRGLFADILLAAFPHLPIEEEGRLDDPELRENFLERVFAYRRLRSLFAPRWTVGELIAFHSAHKLQLMAHSPRHYAELGRSVAAAKITPRPQLRQVYQEGMMTALESRATIRRHVNVLQHAIGYFSGRLDEASRRELVERIDDYRRELVPRIVPLTLVRHYVRRFDLAYLRSQTYFEPYPEDLQQPL